MRTRLGLVSAAALMLAFAAPAIAAPPQQPAMPRSELSQQDMSFLKDAAQGGMAEVELGKLAQNNAQDDQVKQFGAKMVQDHSAANNQLAQIASSKGLQLPQQIDRKDEQQQARLAKLRGTEFDRAYMAAMVKDHDKDAKAFRQEAQAGTDPDLKRFARQTLATIEQHDKLAQNIDSSLTGVGSSMPPRHRLR